MQNRFQSLDGFRAIAVVMVILQHLHSGHSFKALDFLWHFQLGDLGVRIFFIISGFLITSLMQREFDRTGQINLSNFYIRRVLRIFPAYYLFLIIIAAGIPANIQSISVKSFVAPIFFLSNYSENPLVLGHTWSLSVEEQFYLLWPVLIVLLGWRRATTFAITLCVIAPLLRWWATITADPPSTLWSNFQHTGDAIAFGCLYALARKKQWIRGTTAMAYAVIGGLAAAVLLTLATTHVWPMFWNTVGITAANFLVLVILHCALEAPSTAQHKILNTKWMMWVGTLSYSLYLWQQAFIYGGFRLPAPLNVAAIVACALLSYYFVEKPFLSLKDKLQNQPLVQSVNADSGPTRTH